MLLLPSERKRLPIFAVPRAATNARINISRKTEGDGRHIAGVFIFHELSTLARHSNDIISKYVPTFWQPLPGIQ